MSQHQQGENQPRQYTVWSDLRAMKFLSETQDDLRSLKTSTNRLQVWLTIAVIVLGGVAIALTVGLILTYNQLQDVEQQLQQLSITNEKTTDSKHPAS
ncbi:MAG TPA: hypothetical protein ACFE0H_09730 [Elainellaceae cyanobacterium]